MPGTTDTHEELSTGPTWQRISPSALRPRYNEQHVQAVRELLKPDPLIDIVLEPSLSVIDSDFEEITPALDEQLKLSKRMRTLVSEEFTALFVENAPKQLGFVRNPADERITRPTDDLSSIMSTALKRRDARLLDLFNERHRRFEARAIKSGVCLTHPRRVRSSVSQARCIDRR